MTVAVARPTWQSHLAQLVDQITDKGDLRSPRWRDALLAVSRHRFVPHYYLQDTSHRPTRWARHEPGDADSTRRWLELVYSPSWATTPTLVGPRRSRGTPRARSLRPDHRHLLTARLPCWVDRPATTPPGAPQRHSQTLLCVVKGYFKINSGLGDWVVGSHRAVSG